MKIGKSNKVQRELTKQEKNKQNNIKRITVSLFGGIIIFILLVIIQKSIINQEAEQQVYQVTKDIEAGTKLTEENMNKYLGLKSVKVSLIPEGYVTDKAELLDKFTTKDYKTKDIITSDCVIDREDTYTKGIDKPIEISFSVASLAQSVNGIIREGDVIDIYGMTVGEDNSTYNVNKSYTFKHVYVTKAFDNSGSLVGSESKDPDSKSTTNFSVLIDEKDAGQFAEMIENCNIRIAKLLYDTDETYQSFVTTSDGSVISSTNNTQTTSNNNNASQNTGDGAAWYEQSIDWQNSGTTEEVLDSEEVTEETPVAEAEETAETTETTEETAEETTNTDGE